MKNDWDEAAGDEADGMEALIKMSRLLGANDNLVLHGGGNTSLKMVERDFRGRDAWVLRIKGSGSDLRTIEAKHFAAIHLGDALDAESRDAMTDDEMTAYLAHCRMNPDDPNPSIETLLHAFVPSAAVAHSHADAIVALSNNVRGEFHVREALGNDVIQIPYQRPGFALAKAIGAAVQDNPNAVGLVLMNHGLVTWGETCKAAYDAHISLVTQAEEYRAAHTTGRTLLHVQTEPLFSREREQIAAAIAPVLRGAISVPQRMILKGDLEGSPVLDFINSAEAARLSQIGAATPDHILHTKVRPLYVPIEKPNDVDHVSERIRDAAEQWRRDYRAYFERHQSGETMLDSIPRVILLPGLGMWTTGKDHRSASIPEAIYWHTVKIIKDGEEYGGYQSLNEQDAFAAEYWDLELRKLRNAPPEKELARRVALVTGAAGGIGKAIAERFAEAGANVVFADIDGEACAANSRAVNAKHNQTVASPCRMDVTDPESVASAFKNVARRYGGLDILVSNAGIAPTGRIEDLSLETWQKSLDVNATGHFLVAREAVKMMRKQNLGGSIIFNVTKNVFAPGADFGAYSCAKAAELQLCRILAIENGQYGIRCNALNPDAIFEAGLWTPELKAERARAKGIPIEKFEDSIRQSNLLKTGVYAEDVAEAALFFASDRSAKTTGAVLPVDGGLREAFPR